MFVSAVPMKYGFPHFTKSTNTTKIHQSLVNSTFVVRKDCSRLHFCVQNQVFETCFHGYDSPATKRHDHNPPEGNCQILCTFTKVYISESLYFLFKIVSCMIRIFVNTSCTNLNRRIVIRPAMAWNISENLRMKLVYRENTNFQSLNDHKKLEDLQLLSFSHASNSSPSPPPRVVTLNSATGVE